MTKQSYNSLPVSVATPCEALVYVCSALERAPLNSELISAT